MAIAQQGLVTKATVTMLYGASIWITCIQLAEKN
jgi:hypothetical protein